MDGCGEERRKVVRVSSKRRIKGIMMKERNIIKVGDKDLWIEIVR